MNTLQELNNYSNSQIPFEDDRSLIITVGNTTTTTQAVNVAEDAPVDLSTFGVTFSELRSLDNATSDYITLTFDFSAASNPYITWPDKDAYVEGNTKYNNITFGNPSAGVYTAEHIQLNSDYLAVLANTQIVARDQVAPYSYTITVSWPGNTYTQQFDVSTISATETNLNGLSLTARSLYAHLLFDPTLTPRPAVVDNAPDSIYELVLTSSAGATLGLTEGATPTTSVTIPGDLETVNTALQSVYYSPINGFYNQTDTISYSLTVTNPSQGSPYVSETGSFSNYVPAFAEVINLIGRTSNSGGEQALFVAPNLPSVVETVGASVIQLTVSAAQGKLYDQNQSLWVSNLSFTGDGASLTADLQGIQYLPPLILGTNTDTLSYTLTFGGFNLDSGSWIVETSMYFNLNNLTTVTNNNSGVIDLFSTPYPVVDETVDRVIVLNFNTSTGNLKESSTTGSLSNTLTLQGFESVLNSQLPNIQYQAPVLLGTHTDTISWVATCEGVTLGSGTFDVDTTIDTSLRNLFNSNHTVTDIGSASMFPPTYNNGVLPEIISTDPNNQYELEVTFGTGTAEINGISNRIFYAGTPSFVESALLASTYRPLVDDTVHNITYEFKLRNVTIFSGQFQKILPVFFELANLSSSIVWPDQRENSLFTATPQFELIDNTTGYNNITFELDISSTPTPGVFNASTNPSTGTVIYTGYVNPTGLDTDINAEIVATTYNPEDYITPTTEVLGYTVQADNLTWITAASNLEVPQQIDIANINVARTYTQNTKSNPFTVSPNLQLTDLSNSASAGRTFYIEFECSNGVVTRENSAIDVYPWNSPTWYLPSGALRLGPVDITQWNAVLADSTVNPFIYIPDPGSTANETITITIKDAFNTTISTGVVSLNGIARTTPLSGEGVYYTNQASPTQIPISEEMFLFGSMDAVLVSGAGSSCDTNINQNPLFIDASGGGGDGAIAELSDVILNRFDNDITNFGDHLTVIAGAGGTYVPGATSGTNGGNSLIRYDNGVSTIANVLTVYGGGAGNAHGYMTVNNGVNAGNDGGNSGGGGASYRDTVSGFDADVWGPGAVLPSDRNSTYINASEFAEITNSGQTGTLTGAGSSVPAGGDGGTAILTSNISGSTQSYSASGGLPTTYGAGTNQTGTSGDHGQVVIRIKQR